MEEKKLDEPTPKGLEIKDEEGKENITITLGDDVNLGKIVDYLVDEKHIARSITQDGNGNYFYEPVNNATITIKMCGEDQDDTYSVKMSPDKDGDLFKYDKKDKEIVCNGDGIERSEFGYRVKCRNNCIACDIIDNKIYLTDHMYYLIKDIEGNLSWLKTTKDEKPYMCNAKGKNSDPEKIHNNEWKQIRHTFWSNISHWYMNNFDDFDDNIKKQTSKIKRFGRLFIGQQDMTGDCLCGTGCCSFTPSGYNEYDFYKEKQNDNKKSGNNINDNLSQNIFDK